MQMDICSKPNRHHQCAIHHITHTHTLTQATSREVEQQQYNGQI